MSLIHRPFRIVLLALSLATTAVAQVSLKQDAVVYFGSAANTSAPAMLDEARVRDATPEWRTIQAEGVKPGSARYRLLVADMEKRIRGAVKAAAGGFGRDLVVRSGDIEDRQGKDVSDLTDEVISKLGH